MTPDAQDVNFVSHGESNSAIKRLLLLFPLIVLTFLFGCGANPDLETSRMFQKAEDEFSKAKTTDEFTRVAISYQEILDNGFTSGTVLYNQGNAWMQAGQRGRAIACYRQAKRLLPRDPYLDANLRLALSSSELSTNTPLLDYVFFWQQAVSFHEKAFLGTLLLAIALVFLLLGNANVRPVITRRIGVAALVLTSLVAVSIARDWLDIEQTTHGVVIASETTARKGASESYETAFNQPLTEGTEFHVLSANDDWLNISVGDLGAGWVPRRDCTTW